MPPGEATNFTVAHVGRAVGTSTGTLVLNTSHGDLQYEVPRPLCRSAIPALQRLADRAPPQLTAQSTPHPMLLRPLVSGHVPAGKTYTHPITVYNPTDSPIMVSEIYSSSPGLTLDLPNPEENGAFDRTPSTSWLVPPRLSKTLMLLRVDVRGASKVVRGYVTIRSNHSEVNSVIPVRIAFGGADRLHHGPGDGLDFGHVHRTGTGIRREV